MNQFKHLHLFALVLGLGALTPLFAANSSGELIRVVTEGNLAQVKDAIARGVDVNEQEEIIGRTPLIVAASEGNLEIVKYLIEHGAKQDVKDTGDWTALMLAVRNEHTDVVRFLLEKGADPNAKNNLGWTAVMYASLYGHRDIAAALLDHQADPNTKCSEGRTALMYAVGNNHIDTVRLLIEKGADLDVTDVNGWTVLMYAEKNSNGVVLDLLKSAKAAKPHHQEIASQSQEAAPPTIRR